MSAADTGRAVVRRARCTRSGSAEARAPRTSRCATLRHAGAFRWRRTMSRGVSWARHLNRTVAARVPKRQNLRRGALPHALRRVTFDAVHAHDLRVDVEPARAVDERLAQALLIGN